jgi:hypothetical protein
MSRVRGAALAALRSAVESEERNVKRALSVPISFSGGVPVRSAPGEPPRRGPRNPRLMRSVRSSAVANGDVLTGGVGAGPVYSKSGRDYAVSLERGGLNSEAPEHKGKIVVVARRPYMEPSRRRMETLGIESIKAALRGVL